METQLETELYDIYQNAKDINTVKELMIPFLNKIFDIYWREGTEYYTRRKKYNEETMKLAEKMIKNLQMYCMTCGISADLVLTSSLNAGTNLMDDSESNGSLKQETYVPSFSDIDISMLIENYDNEIAIEIGKKLAVFGFVYKHLFNPFQPLNSYYSYTKIEDGVEFEVKLRDREKSQIILNLHKYMETKLSVQEKIAITYGKLLFKTISRTAFLTFKKLVFERYLAEIEGGFMLEVHY